MNVFAFWQTWNKLNRLKSHLTQGFRSKMHITSLKAKDGKSGKTSSRDISFYIFYECTCCSSAKLFFAFFCCPGINLKWWRKIKIKNIAISIFWERNLPKDRKFITCTYVMFVKMIWTETLLWQKKNFQPFISLIAQIDGLLKYIPLFLMRHIAKFTIRLYFHCWQVCCFLLIKPLLHSVFKSRKCKLIVQFWNNFRKLHVEVGNVM